MRPLLCAIGFLTRLPVPAGVHDDTTALKRAPSWFALVGLILGCIYAGSTWLFAQALPPSVLAALLVVEDALLTGALHLDGLADVADGFGGGATRQDVLRIMRDHAIGSYGAVAVVLFFLLKYACLAELLHAPFGLWFLFVTPMISRWGIVLLSVLEPYARASTSGTGGLAGGITKRQLIIPTLTCIAAVFVFGWRRTGTCWAAVALCTLAVSRYSRRRIEGITGDVLGANVVICEALQFVCAVAIRGW